MLASYFVILGIYFLLGLIVTIAYRIITKTKMSLFDYIFGSIMWAIIILGVIGVRVLVFLSEKEI